MDTADHFTPAEKAVATIVAIGKPAATQLLNLLTRDEVNILIAASKGMKAISQKGLELITGEFEAEFTKGIGLLDSSTQMDAILSASFDETELASILGEGKPMPDVELPTLDIWSRLTSIDARELAEFLEQENAQVAAYVLSRLSAGQAAEITKDMEPVARSRILTRILSVKEPPADIAALVEEAMLERFGATDKVEGKKGISNLASILNEMDRDRSEDILETLSQVTEPESVMAIRSRLFRFEDIEKLDASARTAIFDSLPADTITMALRQAEPELTEAILSSISQRTRRMIEGDLRSNVQVRMPDITSARKVIVNLALELASSGRIVISNQGAEAA